MLRGSIVPKGDRSGLPAEAALDFRICCLAIELCEQPVALIARQAVYMAGEGRVDIEAGQARFRMGAHYRMSLRRVFRLELGGRLAEPTSENQGDVMNSRQS